MNDNVDMARYWTDDVGPAWVAEQARLDERFGPLTEALLRELAPQAGEAVLDVGCGTGGSTVRLAQLIGSEGRVVATDISSTMLEAGRARPVAGDAAPISWICADAQTYPFERERFDGVVSRLGVMFFSDPVRAFANLRGALRPGGRLVFACWQDPSVNPWFFAGVEELREMFEMPEPPAANTPGPFGLADASRTHALLDAAGFASVEIEPLPVEVPFSGSAEDMVAHVMTIGPVGGLLRAAPDRAETAAAVRERLIEVFGKLDAEHGLDTTANAWLVRALP